MKVQIKALFGRDTGIDYILYLDPTEEMKYNFLRKLMKAVDELKEENGKTRKPKMSGMSKSDDIKTQ